MSDSIKHECGIAFLRLRKPLDFYREKYGSPLYGINKMYLLMEKQHNRGQDGAGIANIKLDPEPGHRFISRVRSIDPQAIKDVFEKVSHRFKEVRHRNPEIFLDTARMKRELAFTGELFLGHLRYGTYGKNSIESCHPFLRQNNRISKNLLVAGNFNLTNVDELFEEIVGFGLHPKEKADTVTVMEKIGHFLDREVDAIYNQNRAAGMSRQEAVASIPDALDLGKVLKLASSKFDGGYVMCGLVGHGDGFVLRDPNGIRPAYYYEDEEVSVVCSERAVIQTVFNVPFESIKELPAGHAFISKKNGVSYIEQINEAGEKLSCSFERIYFSRGSDAEIYAERKELGRNVVPEILKAIDYDVDNSVFSFIPNTAESSFYGMLKGVEDYLNALKIEEIKAKGSTLSDTDLEILINHRPRVEKLAIKDVKLRTFITDDEHRDDMVTHVYDITYGTVRPGIDNIVIIDDSIVRGTTLKKSIIKMLSRLQPKSIVVVSSAPQIRYPDCYGIDMAKLNDFVAFRAAVSLLKEQNKWHIVEEAYALAKKSLDDPNWDGSNYTKALYAPFSDEELSKKIAELVTDDDIECEVKVVFQTVENLHKSCPGHLGDWYFTGNFPTRGGSMVSNKALINFVEGKNIRAY